MQIRCYLRKVRKRKSRQKVEENVIVICSLWLKHNAKVAIYKHIYAYNQELYNDNQPIKYFYNQKIAPAKLLG